MAVHDIGARNDNGTCLAVPTGLVAERLDSAVVFSHYEVRVRDLMVMADIGIHHHELGKLQPLIISLVAKIQGGLPREGQNVLNYQVIPQIAERLAKERTGLIETFAARLAENVLVFDDVECVEILIEKPKALAPAMAGVRIIAERPRR